MLTGTGEIRLEPTTVHVDTLLDDVMRGLVRVPVFQRPFVWRPEQMLDLFDSIEHGYPIGSLLLWQTDLPIRSLDRIGAVELPAVAPGSQVSYVLDGHQRLSTLVGTLRRASDRHATLDGRRDWKWHIYRDLDPRTETERYRHHRAQTSAPEGFLPLRAVTRTMDFLQFARVLEMRVKDRDRVDRMIRTAEAVAQRIKTYKLAVIRLQGGGLDQAVEVYTRLNRKGTRMDADQMVSALTHQPGQPSLAERIDEVVAAVAATGFGEIPRLAVFRTVLAVSGEPDIMSPRWEAVAGRLERRLVAAGAETEHVIRRAVDFLRDVVGLPLAKFLPYAHQLMLLAMFFKDCPEPSEEQQRQLRRWFWVTSWSSSFAGATSTTLRRALRDMSEFARQRQPLELDLTDAQPLPDAFNLNSARTRAYITWELNALPDRLDALGQRFDLVKYLASADSQAFRPVVEGDRRPANRLVLLTPPGITVRKALVQLDELLAPISSGRVDRVLDSHGIPYLAWRRLQDGCGSIFVEERTNYLASRLRTFADEIGVPLGRELEGVAEDDTD